MSIDVTILEFPQDASLTESNMTFNEQGGTFGRAQNNTWVLDDPDRFLSGCHSKIIFEGGSYFLLDSSTNGTFVNNSSEPLGKGNRVQLNDGDIFELSEYKFKVQITGEAAVAVHENTPSVLDDDDPFGSALGSATANPMPYTPPVQSDSFKQEPFAQDPFGGTPATVAPLTNQIEETDPLAALDRSNQSFDQVTPQSASFVDDNSYTDNSGAIDQAVSWPSTEQQKGIIPQDWDDDEAAVNTPTPAAPAVSIKPAKTADRWEDGALESKSAESKKPRTAPVPRKNSETARKSPETDRSKQSISISESEARRRALEKDNRKIKAEVVNLKKQLASMKKRSSSAVETCIVDAIGFEGHDLDDDKITEINELSGEFIRYAIEGLMQTLSSRNNVKNTFRMNMTTIQPIENNPLKFSANVDDALENMFLKVGNSYKKPIETIQESFESIADHQVAILAGIRSAFKSIVNRFEPKILESRFEKQNKRGLIPRNEKAKYWDAFNTYYEELFSDVDNSFQYLFGDEFSQAYEEQLQMLSFARKEQNKTSKLRE